MKGEKPPAPTRFLRKFGASATDDADADEGDADGGAADGGETVNVADLVPRTDIRYFICMDKYKCVICYCLVSSNFLFLKSLLH